MVHDVEYLKKKTYNKNNTLLNGENVSSAQSMTAVNMQCLQSWKVLRMKISIFEFYFRKRRTYRILYAFTTHDITLDNVRIKRL